MLANILANPLIELAPSLVRLVGTQGDLVLSGILEQQAAQVRQAYARWFDFSETIAKDGWARLHGIKNPVSFG